MAKKREKGGKLQCRYGCGKEFGSETWKGKHEDEKCHLRLEVRTSPALRGQIQRPATLPTKPPSLVATREGGSDGSVEEDPDLPNTPIVGRAIDLREIVTQLKAKRDRLISEMPEIRKLDVAISALEAV